MTTASKDLNLFLLGLLMILILGITLSIGCNFEKEKFTIKVTGAEGIRFEGDYGTSWSADGWVGDQEARHVKGTVPAEYHVEGQIVWCLLEKKSESGLLRVQIIRNGEVVSEAETLEPFGSVSTQAYYRNTE